MGQYSLWFQPICLFFFVVIILQNVYQLSSSSSNLSSSTGATHNNINDSIYHLCPYHQSLALLQFKQSFTIYRNASLECDFDGKGFTANVSYPKTMLWNGSTSDCCKWDGVACDEFTGDVVGLDLSCSQLQGAIHSNSTLFQLSHLQTLNLAYNDFSLSLSRGGISHAFGGFTSLTHLNLSFCEFSGQIPSEISHLSKLVSLDLSYNFDISANSVSFGPHNNNFKMLLQNLTQLSTLFLNWVDINSDLPNNLSSSLTSISLSHTGLHGKLPDNIFDLPNLKSLVLSDNYLTGNIPNLKSLVLSDNYLTGNIPKLVKNNKSSVGRSSLEMLDLSYNHGLSGEVADSLLSHLKYSLNYLDLSDCNFWGYIPKSLGNLTQLTHLSLGDNNFNGEIPSTLSNLDKLTYLDLSYSNFSGYIPKSLWNLTQLTDLSLSGNNFNGEIPSMLSNLDKLNYLYLSDCNFSGYIPKSLWNLTQLTYLSLSGNNFNGEIPSMLSNLDKLNYLDLSDCNFSGYIPKSLWNLTQLTSLELRYNNFNGTVPSWLFTLPSLLSIDLSNNQLHGTIPKSVSKLVNLTELVLSSNNLSGVVELEMFLNLKKIWYLDLSYNSDLLSFSTTNNNVNTTLPNLQILGLADCKITKFPNFLRYSENLQTLDLSNNNIEGQIPKWAWSMWRDSLSYLNLSHNSLTSLHLQQEEIPWKYLDILDLRSNLLEGPLLIPSSLKMSYFFMSNNKLTGEISSLICKLSSLQIIDLSNNSLTGVIPQCLANFSDSLTVLDLRMNGFIGTIPDTFSKGNQLRNLGLNGNHLEGRVPLSLKNCTQLEVLDLGNNNITDTFPHWLASLPNLQVLVFKSNRFHGPITTPHTKLFFPKLRIIDLSHNEFTSHLPNEYFNNFKAMMNVDDGKMGLKYMGDMYYQDSITVMVKGFDIELGRILTVFTTIDLSSNKFIGEIPKLIGDLNSLRLLNLSHNNLTGHIPPSMGNMKKLESLDLSSNQLVGEIPGQLTGLTFLAVLNLSKNHLVGQIPRGKQFDTFENDSYSGNLELCGVPLSKRCREDESRLPAPLPRVVPNEDDSEFFSGFTWKSVVMGYGCGMVFGLVMGCTMFLIGKPKWFVGIVEREQHKRGKRSKMSAGPGRGRGGRRLM